MEQLQVKNDVAKLQQLLGSKLYSDKYSFIQEALQNSTDAMRKCGKHEESFDVNINYRDRNYYFSIRDYGCSFDSIKDFKRLIGTLLESSKTQTKDNSENQELGKFGIGSISVAAYYNTWNYTVYKNGRAFDAILQEIDGQGIFMKTSDYYDTEEKDGVFMEVKIIDQIDNFITKLLEKAKYFQNVVFNFDADVLNAVRWNNNREKIVKINEDFKIFKSEDFQYSTLNESPSVHICLDQYSYDIKWSELGIGPIHLPIALRFSLDDFETNPTREVLTIKPDYKEKIIAKLEKVTDWFIDRWNEENPERECIGFTDYCNEIEKRKMKIVYIAGQPIDIQSIWYLFSQRSFNKPTFKGVGSEALEFFKTFLDRFKNSLYQPVATIKGSVLKRPNYVNIEERPFYFVKKSLGKNYQTYFKTVLYDNKHRFFRKKKFELVFEYEDKMLPDKFSFLTYLKLYESKDYTNFSAEELEYSKKQFRDLKVLLESFEESVPYAEDVVPVEFINELNKSSKKKKDKIEKGEDEIILKYPREPQKWITWNAVWDDKAVKVKDLRKLKALHIYGTENKRKQLEQIFTFAKKSNLQSIMVNEKIEKIIKEEDPHNFIHIDDLKQKFGKVSNYMTSLHIQNEMKGYQYLLNNTAFIQEYISTAIAEDIDSLKKIIRTYDVDYNIYDGAITQEIYQLYKEKPILFNQEHMHIFNKVNKIKNNLDFLYLFVDNIRLKTTDPKKYELSIKTMRDLCRMRKVKMNWQNYNLDKIEESNDQERTN